MKTEYLASEVRENCLIRQTFLLQLEIMDIKSKNKPG